MSEILSRENENILVYYDANVGGGGNGSVYKVSCVFDKKINCPIPLDGDYVIKTYGGNDSGKKDKTDKAIMRCKVEINALITLQGKGIVPDLLKIGSCYATGSDWFIMKFYKAKNDKFFEKKTSIDCFFRKIHFFRQLVVSFSVMHSVGIYHRDLKRNNILYDGEKPLLCDFGLAYIDDVSDDLILTLGNEIIGSPGFIAPELFGNRHLKGKLLKNVYPKSDVFALTRLFACSILGRRFLGECPDLMTLLDDFKISNLHSFSLDVFKGVLNECYKRGTCFNYNDRLSLSNFSEYLDKLERCLNNDNNGLEKYAMSYESFYLANQMTFAETREIIDLKSIYDFLYTCIYMISFKGKPVKDIAIKSESIIFQLDTANNISYEVVPAKMIIKGKLDCIETIILINRNDIVSSSRIGGDISGYDLIDPNKPKILDIAPGESVELYK